MYKPRIDWVRIIWKCQSRFNYGSEAYYFATEQCLMFEINQLKELHKIQDSGRAGHKNKYRRYKTQYKWPSDLNCDDPYYDGIPVLG